MRIPAIVASACLAATAFLPIARAGSGARAIYVKHAETAMAAGRWGDAMAAFDAAHDEAPRDAKIAAGRAEAAAKWVAEKAPTIGSATPDEKALVLLNALAEQGNKRGAGEAVRQHVVPLLDAAVARVWGAEETGDDPARLWRAVSRGELLTQSLPDDSPARARFVALRQRAAIAYERLARASKATGAVFVYEAMAARMTGGKPSAAAVEALGAITEFDYTMSVTTPKQCPLLEAELKKRLDFFKNMNPRPGGLPAEVHVMVDCVPLAPPRQRQESRSWVESHIETTAVKSCTNRTVQATSGSYSVSSREGMGGTRITTYTDVSPTYKTVPDCSTSYNSEKITENKTDIVTITTQEFGYDARGAAIIAVVGRAFRMPLSSRVVFDKVTTEGQIFGTREESTMFTQDFLPFTAHGIWLELVYLNEAAHEGYVASLLERAKSESGEAQLGDMVTAVRVHHRVTGDYARWFGERLGTSEQELAELVIDAPRVKPSLKLAGDYKLEVPKVDPNLLRTVNQKKEAAGEDPFK